MPNKNYLNRLPSKNQGIDLRQKCRLYSRQALATVLRIMRDDSFGPMVRLQAAQTILDRGWGKAPQQLDVSIEHRLAQLSDSELKAHIQELALEVGSQTGLVLIPAPDDFTDEHGEAA